MVLFSDQAQTVDTRKFALVVSHVWSPSNWAMSNSEMYEEANRQTRGFQVPSTGHGAVNTVALNTYEVKNFGA